MNAEGFLKKHCKLNDWNKLEEDLNDSLWTNNVINYMEEYHQAQLKLLGIDDVVLRSELLLAVICEYNKINTYTEIKKVEEWLEKWDSK